MKAKEKFELIFILIVIILVGGLVYIHFADLSSDSYLPKNIKDLFNRNNYEIIDKIEVCEGGKEEFFTDEEYTYYFDCDKSKFIYLEWDDGTITPMMDELNSGNVKIDSLIDHGLKCNKKSLYEEENETNETSETNESLENETIEEENATENQTNED